MKRNGHGSCYSGVSHDLLFLVHRRWGGHHLEVQIFNGSASEMYVILITYQVVGIRVKYWP